MSDFIAGYIYDIIRGKSLGEAALHCDQFVPRLSLNDCLGKL